MDKLKVGDRFVQTFEKEHVIQFEVLSIDEDANKVTVKCYCNETGPWEENWDDLHCVYAALENGDYAMCSNPKYFRKGEDVLVRNSDYEPWEYGIYGRYDEEKDLFQCIGRGYRQCVKVDMTTKQYVGTKLQVPPKYITWRF